MGAPPADPMREFARGVVHVAPPCCFWVPGRAAATGADALHLWSSDCGGARSHPSERRRFDLLIGFAQQQVESLAPMLDPPDEINERADRHGHGRDLNPINKCASMIHGAVSLQGAVRNHDPAGGGGNNAAK